VISQIIHLYLIIELSRSTCFSFGPQAYKLLCGKCFLELDRTQDIASSKESQVNAPCEGCGKDSLIRKRFECHFHGEFEVELSRLDEPSRCAFCGHRAKDLGLI
jgi:hypothetical protein